MENRLSSLGHVKKIITQKKKNLEKLESWERDIEKREHRNARSLGIWIRHKTK
jgi:hypothetical protein